MSAKIAKVRQLPYPYQRRPVVVKNEDDSTEESLLFRRGKGINQKARAHSASEAYRRVNQSNKPEQVNFNIPQEIITGNGLITPSEDFENNLSTTGQELYIGDDQDINQDGRDSLNGGPVPTSSWPQLGVAEDEGLLMNFDQDVEWLLSAKDKDHQDYFGNSQIQSNDPFLKDLGNQNRNSNTSPVGIANAPSATDVPLEVKVPMVADPTLELIPEQKTPDDHLIISNPKKSTSPQEETKIKSDRLSPKPGSPKYQKYYSWYEYRSPPKSPNDSRRGSLSQPVVTDTKSRDVSPTDSTRMKSKNAAHTTSSPSQQNKKDNGMIVSKSLPAFPPKQTSSTQKELKEDSNSLRQGSMSQEGSKISLQGLTNHVFEGAYTESPYVEHLTKPNHALKALQNPVFANRPGMKGLNLNSSPKAATKKKLKNYAIIKDDSNPLALMSKTAPLPAQTRFPPIPNKKGKFSNYHHHQQQQLTKYNSNALLESVYERPDHLYLKSKKMMEQVKKDFSTSNFTFAGADRSRARMTSRQGINHYPISESTNLMNSHPTSPAILRALSPPTFHDNSQIGTSLYSNNIDTMIATMQIDSTQRTSGMMKKNKNLVSSPSLLSLYNSSQEGFHPITSNFQVSHVNTNSTTMIPNESETELPQYNALEMLNNIHIDPLYRIIRDEIETLLKTHHSHHPSSSTSISTPLLLSTYNTINANNIRILSNFQSLPPSAWVICRIVYFLIMAYYETIISRPSYQEYRKLMQLDSIWKILSRHYHEEHLTIHTIHKIFSWPYLQELMLTSNNSFLKLLEVIEHGVQLTTSQWKLFRETVKKLIFQQRHHQQQQQQQPPSERGGEGGGGNVSIEGNGMVGEEVPLEQITNNEQSRNLFYDLFPISGLTPLRAMVKAAKVFLTANNSSLYQKNNAAIGASNGLPANLSTAAAPGSPLAITITMTAWVKRIIALLYVSTTQRLKQMQFSVDPERPFASTEINESVAINAEPPNNPVTTATVTIDAPSGSSTERLSLVPPPVDSQKIMNQVLLQQSHHYPKTLSVLLILHHPSTMSTGSREERHRHMQELLLSPEGSPIGGIRTEETSGRTTIKRGVPAYFQIATSFIKPADQLQVLVMKPISHPNDLKMITSQDEFDYEQQQRQQPSLSIGGIHQSQWDDYLLLKKDIQKHLRITSSSPLHTVQILPMENYYLLKQRVHHDSQPSLQQPLSSRNETFTTTQAMMDCFLFHDGLVACLRQIFPTVFPPPVTTASTRSETPNGSRREGDLMDPLLGSRAVSPSSHINNGVPVLNHSQTTLQSKPIDLFLTEFRIGQRNPPMIKSKKSVNYSDEIQLKATEELKEKLVFSLGLMNDSMSIHSGHVTRLRGSRYVVCVTDTMNSWNAFEMARKLAKESDSIYLYHLPMLSYWELRLLIQDLTPQSSELRDLYQSDYQRSALTYAQYQLLTQQLVQRQEKIITLYRNLGYNVLLGEIPDYLVVVERLMRNYSIMMRYNTELYEQQQQQTEGGDDHLFDGLLPQERYLYYQYNEEMKGYCRQLLLAMASLEADYVIVGADNDDIYASLTNEYESSFFKFQACPLEAFTYDITATTTTTTAARATATPASTSAPATHSYSSHQLPVMSALTSRDYTDGYYNSSHNNNNPIPRDSAYFTEATFTTNGSSSAHVFEEKGILFFDGEGDSTSLLEVPLTAAHPPPQEEPSSRHMTEKEPRGNDSYEGEEYEEDWSEERSQVKSSQGKPATKTPTVVMATSQAAMAANSHENNSQTNEYDLDSFIVEDNDEEGIDSLTASPYMMDRHHLQHAHEIERKQLQHSQHHHQQQQPHLHQPDPPVMIMPQPIIQREIHRKRLSFHKKHLKYYQQYAIQPISFLTMLLHEAMTIDQWADESNQSISGSILSPHSLSGRGGQQMSTSAFSPTHKASSYTATEKSPLGFFSFILANSPFIHRDHQGHHHYLSQSNVHHHPSSLSPSAPPNKSSSEHHPQHHPTAHVHKPNLYVPPAH